MATARKVRTRKSAAAKHTGRARPDATRLLERDHKDVKALFKRYDELAQAQADGGERRQLAEQICAMLTVHTTIEEELFYPALREAELDENLLAEAEVEHASAKDLIEQVRSMAPDDDLYDAKVTVLGEYINHHVTEEEGEIFPKARRNKALDLGTLAEELQRRKDELMPGSEESGTQRVREPA